MCHVCVLTATRGSFLVSLTYRMYVAGYQNDSPLIFEGKLTREENTLGRTTWYKFMFIFFIEGLYTCLNTQMSCHSSLVQF